MKVRGYWNWYPDLPGPLPAWPPVQNYLSWFGLSLVLAFVLPPNHALRRRSPSPSRPILTLALMNALFFRRLRRALAARQKLTVARLRLAQTVPGEAGGNGSKGGNGSDEFLSASQKLLE